tara:strand:+ start:402 stop:2651 length:2250 start_codon:yes stop_codon:yes gene_type:complete
MKKSNILLLTFSLLVFLGSLSIVGAVSVTSENPFDWTDLPCTEIEGDLYYTAADGSSFGPITEIGNAKNGCINAIARTEFFCKDGTTYQRIYSCDDGCSGNLCLEELKVLGELPEASECTYDQECASNSCETSYTNTKNLCCSENTCAHIDTCVSEGTEQPSGTDTLTCSKGAWVIKAGEGQECTSDAACGALKCKQSMVTNTKVCCDENLCANKPWGSDKCVGEGFIKTIGGISKGCKSGDWVVLENQGNQCDSDAVCASDNCVEGICCPAGMCSKIINDNGYCYNQGDKNYQGSQTTCVNGEWIDPVDGCYYVHETDGVMPEGTVAKTYYNPPQVGKYTPYHSWWHFTSLGKYIATVHTDGISSHSCTDGEVTYNKCGADLNGYKDDWSSGTDVALGEATVKDCPATCKPDGSECCEVEKGNEYCSDVLGSFANPLNEARYVINTSINLCDQQEYVSKEIDCNSIEQFGQQKTCVKIGADARCKLTCVYDTLPEINPVKYKCYESTWSGNYYYKYECQEGGYYPDYGDYHQGECPVEDLSCTITSDCDYGLVCLGGTCQQAPDAPEAPTVESCTPGESAGKACFTGLGYYAERWYYVNANYGDDCQIKPDLYENGNPKGGENCGKSGAFVCDNDYGCCYDLIPDTSSCGGTMLDGTTVEAFKIYNFTSSNGVCVPEPNPLEHVTDCKEHHGLDTPTTCHDGGDKKVQCAQCGYKICAQSWGFTFREPTQPCFDNEEDKGFVTGPNCP